MRKLFRYYINLRGWHTKKKIVVIESDDWGSIRMPGFASFKRLSEKNPALDKDPYSKYDSFINKTDLNDLLETLGSFSDVKGNHPVITANMIMANPDFEKIRAADFKSYFFEPFFTTVSRSQNSNETLKLWGQGIHQKLIHPQLHGREHVHVPGWLEELRNGNTDLMQAFNEGCFAVPYKPTKANRRKNLSAALDELGIENEVDFHRTSLKDAANLFKEYFGFGSKTFIAPAYTWHSQLEPSLQEIGVTCLQGLPFQYEPNLKSNDYRKKIHYTGQRNELNLCYTVRNVFFEPSTNPSFDWLGDSLKRINEAFSFRKPAIVSMHRLNVIGSIDQKNKKDNLVLLKELLLQISLRWPNVEFMSSAELADEIENTFGPN